MKKASRKHQIASTAIQLFDAINGRGLVKFVVTSSWFTESTVHSNNSQIQQKSCIDNLNQYKANLASLSTQPSFHHNIKGCAVELGSTDSGDFNINVGWFGQLSFELDMHHGKDYSIKLIFYTSSEIAIRQRAREFEVSLR